MWYRVVCRRAVEELLKETDRARVRAETMGPAGWCMGARYLQSAIDLLKIPQAAEDPGNWALSGLQTVKPMAWSLQSHMVSK
ncbi:hypothetical protein JOQ06_018183 [Pogonophryne albipinna]|uniref:Uncharacterized protein n=1 Tax=Pogonophryne albipinna TaxID=1090488 RepID=A0AAD6F9F4_9TELE|nr:hypothetical protein JOQ06_018183 [Pogonophryne albipinna]